MTKAREDAAKALSLIQSLPDDLARAMLANAHHAVNLDEDIEGEVAL